MNTDELERQGKLIARFIAAFTRIESYVSSRITNPLGDSIPKLVERFCDSCERTDISLHRVRTASYLRNAFSHGQVKERQFPACPNEEFVKEIETIAKRLANPLLITSRCKRQVETASPDDSLRALLIRMSELQLSQFPVYAAGKFAGMISENSIARWISERACEQETFNFADVTVQNVIDKSSDSSAYKFVHERTTEPVALQLFASNLLLEACLTTKLGGQHEELIGIVTRWDIPIIMAQLTAPPEDANPA